jgi:hypothetical protein
MSSRRRVLWVGVESRLWRRVSGEVIWRESRMVRGPEGVRWAWMMRAVRLLPEPVGPVMRVGTGLVQARAMPMKTGWRQGALPMRLAVWGESGGVGVGVAGSGWGWRRDWRAVSSWRRSRGLVR